MMTVQDKTSERVPILKFGQYLLISIQVDMHDRMAINLQDELTTRIVQTGAKGVLIDISTLDIVDSFIGRVLGTIASVGKLLGAHTVLVGMRPAIAITLLELGVRLERIHTALNVEDGMELLQRLSTRRPGVARKGRRDLRHHQ
jgi:rsbT antagonist protein RsbS